MTDLHFIDTNILLYSISGDPLESAKRARAIEILNLERGALSIQVLQEFYVQATRASRANAVSHKIASGLIQTWTRFVVQDLTLAILNGALDIRATYGFSYWDSAILAAARSIGCKTLYSEDMSHGQTVDGVLIVNPFR